MPRRDLAPGVRGRAGPTRAGRFARDERGAVGIELAIGVVALITVAVACFAVYSRVEAHTAAPRIAIVMADYLSREEAPDGGQLDALAEFLRDHVLGADHHLLAVINVLRQEAGDPEPDVLWGDDGYAIALGDEAQELADKCRGVGAWTELPDMDDGEMVFVVEVCARAGGTGPRAAFGDLYYRYLLPSRSPDVIPMRPQRGTL